jgi:hypothetical protein
MGVCAALEHGYKKVTGRHVGPWVDFGAGYGLGVDDWLGHSMIDAY